MKKFDRNKQICLPRKELKDTQIDLEGRALILGFNEPRFRKSKRKKTVGDIDSKLNARFVTYFLPLVELAKQQKNPPRVYIMSGIVAALRYNSETENQRKILLANNKLKIDFLQKFFEYFFDDTFLLIEYVCPQDILKVSETELLKFWEIIEQRYPDELRTLKFHLAKFAYPRKFNVSDIKDLTLEQRNELQTIDLSNPITYCLFHVFALGDINFEGNYVHCSRGYVSVGGPSESVFNTFRDLAFKTLKDLDYKFFEKKIELFDNFKIVLTDEQKVPTPYNGMIKKNELYEVTYENERSLDFYDEEPKIKPQMDYMYENIVPKDQYKLFWNNYKARYFKLKERYRRAYEIEGEW
ncbi:hypothetical protein CSB37_03705 [bacterium DOLZORAL124_38_8]|nr:MAG: hypothetical protein CSB37_03705 [bacterium DOLZORAL124_38_8]